MMNLGHTLDRTLRPLSPELAAASARVMAFLAEGGRVAAISGPAGAGKKAVVEAVVLGMPGQVLRVRNPGPGPLDLAAILKQLGQTVENEADQQGLFIRTLTELAYDDQPVVLLIENAHTLTSFALLALSRVPGLGRPDLPELVLLMSGEPELLLKMGAPGLELLRNQRRTLLVKLKLIEKPVSISPAQPVTAPPIAGPGCAGKLIAPHGAPLRSPHDLRVAGLAALTGSLLTVAVFVWPWRPVSSGQAMKPSVTVELPMTLAAGVPDVMPDLPLQTTIPTPSSAPTVDAPATPMPALSITERLHRDFDGFLDRAGRDTASLTPKARQVLFREYLRWGGHKTRM